MLKDVSVKGVWMDGFVLEVEAFLLIYSSSIRWAYFILDYGMCLMVKGFVEFLTYKFPIML